MRRRELPILKAQEIMGKDRLTVFAVSYREKPEAAREIEKLASTWQINMVEDTWGSIVDDINHTFAGAPPTPPAGSGST